MAGKEPITADKRYAVEPVAAAKAIQSLKYKGPGLTVWPWDGTPPKFLETRCQSTLGMQN